MNCRYHIVVAGRYISATYEAQGECKTIPICDSIPGVAATLCVKNKINSR